jgi:hypothetical protein
MVVVPGRKEASRAEAGGGREEAAPTEGRVTWSGTGGEGEEEEEEEEGGEVGMRAKVGVGTEEAGPAQSRTTGNCGPEEE